MEEIFAIFTLVIYIFIIKKIIEFINNTIKNKKRKNWNYPKHTNNDNNTFKKINEIKIQNNTSGNVKYDNNINNTNNLNNNEISNDFLNSFYKKEYLLTREELKFYKTLRPITDKLNLNLFCQVAMYELVNCKNYKYFNSIKSKSIDFVITENNCKIRCCIELDDFTHNYNSRKKGDMVKNEIFRKLKINFFRINVQNYYDVNKLEQMIIRCIQ